MPRQINKLYNAVNDQAFQINNLKNTKISSDINYSLSKINRIIICENLLLTVLDTPYIIEKKITNLSEEQLAFFTIVSVFYSEDGSTIDLNNVNQTCQPIISNTWKQLDENIFLLKITIWASFAETIISGLSYSYYALPLYLNLYMLYPNFG